MMRFSRPCVATAARKSHARALRARVRFWCAHGVRERAICMQLWWRTVDSTASLCVVFKRCSVMRLNRPYAVAAVRKSCARASHAHAQKTG
eukprot:3631285-Lingulodinium_polyedra.AAC.1